MKKNRPVIKNMFTDCGNYSKEWNDEPSLFEPDQTMSIREIMERYARGLPIADGMYKNPVYLDEEEFPDLRKFDLAEVEEMKKQAAENVETHRKTLREIEAQQKAEVRKAMESRKKDNGEE